MIQLTRSGTVVSASPRDLDHLRERFEREHCVRLPQFLEPGLCRFIQSEIDRAQFHERVYEDMEPVLRDLTMTTNVADGMLDLLLMNDAKLFEFIQCVTGSGPIGSFAGRVYRLIPGQHHYEAWHDDLGGHRLVAISINLGRERYAGGVLQIRERASGAIVHESANTGAGDAIVFRLSRLLEHRVTKLQGHVAKTAFSGWFCSQPVLDLMVALRTNYRLVE